MLFVGGGSNNTNAIAKNVKLSYEELGGADKVWLENSWKGLQDCVNSGFGIVDKYNVNTDIKVRHAEH